MSQQIQLRRSHVPGKVPTINELALGEIAINTHDGRVFIKQSDERGERIIEIGTISGSVASNVSASLGAPLTFGYGLTSNRTSYNASLPTTLAVSPIFTPLSTYNTFTASVLRDSASFDIRINNISGSGVSGSFIQNQYVGPQTANFWITGPARIDGEVLIYTTDQGNYKLQVSGGFFLSGTLVNPDLPNNQDLNQFVCIDTGSGKFYYKTGSLSTINFGLQNKIAYYPADGYVIDDITSLEWEPSSRRLSIDASGFSGASSGFKSIYHYFHDTSNSYKWFIRYFNGGLDFVEYGIAQRVFFKDGGGVGINNANPSYSLDIIGNLFLSQSNGNGSGSIFNPTIQNNQSLNQFVCVDTSSGQFYYRSGSLGGSSNIDTSIFVLTSSYNPFTQSINIWSSSINIFTASVLRDSASFANYESSISDYRKNNFQLANSLNLIYRNENKQTHSFTLTTHSFIHGFIYAKNKLWGSDMSNPNNLYRFNNPDNLSDVDVIQIGLNSNFQDGYDIIYVPSKDKIYTITNDQGLTGNSYLVEVDPITLSKTNVLIVDTAFFEFQSLTFSGSYLFIGTGASSTIGKIIKVNLSDYSFTSSSLNGFGDIHCLRYDGTYLYGTSNSGGKICKVNPIDLNTILTSSIIPTPTDDFCFAGDYIWVGFEGVIGNLSKIKKSDFSSTTISTGIASECYGTFFGGKYVWGVFNTVPGTIVRIDPETHEIYKFNLETGENNPNEIVTDGQRLFITCYSSPAKVIRLDVPQLTYVSSQFPFLITSSFNSFSQSIHNFTSSITNIVNGVYASQSMYTLTASFHPYSQSINTWTQSINSFTASIVGAVSSSVSGTLNYISKFTDKNKIGNSNVFESASFLYISESISVTGSGTFKNMSGSTDRLVKVDGFGTLVTSSLGESVLITTSSLNNNLSYYTLTASFQPYSQSINIWTSSINNWSASLSSSEYWIKNQNTQKQTASFHITGSGVVSGTIFNPLIGNDQTQNQFVVVDTGSGRFYYRSGSVVDLSGYTLLTEFRPFSQSIHNFTASIVGAVSSSVTGTLNYIPKFVDKNKLGNSNIFESASMLYVSESISITGSGTFKNLSESLNRLIKVDAFGTLITSSLSEGAVATTSSLASYTLTSSFHPYSQSINTWSSSINSFTSSVNIWSSSLSSSEYWIKNQNTLKQTASFHITGSGIISGTIYNPLIGNDQNLNQFVVIDTGSGRFYYRSGSLGGSSVTNLATDKQILFETGSSISGSNNLRWDYSINLLTLTGSLLANMSNENSARYQFSGSTYLKGTTTIEQGAVFNEGNGATVGAARMLIGGNTTASIFIKPENAGFGKEFFRIDGIGLIGGIASTYAVLKNTGGRHDANTVGFDMDFAVGENFQSYLKAFNINITKSLVGTGGSPNLYAFYITIDQTPGSSGDSIGAYYNITNTGAGRAYSIYGNSGSLYNKDKVFLGGPITDYGSYKLQVTDGLLVTGSIVSGSIYNPTIQNNQSLNQFVCVDTGSGRFYYRSGSLGTGTATDVSGYTLTASFHPYSQSINNFTSSINDWSASINNRGTLTLSSSLIQNKSTGSFNSGSFVVYNSSTSSFDALFVNYVIISGSKNKRAGNFIATWSGSVSSFTDFSTVDIGYTKGVSFICGITGSNASMLMIISGSDGWVLKANYQNI